MRGVVVNSAVRVSSTRACGSCSVNTRSDNYITTRFSKFFIIKFNNEALIPFEIFSLTIEVSVLI